jgi:hypothetical protein
MKQQSKEITVLPFLPRQHYDGRPISLSPPSETPHFQQSTLASLLRLAAGSTRPHPPVPVANQTSNTFQSVFLSLSAIADRQCAVLTGLCLGMLLAGARRRWMKLLLLHYHSVVWNWKTIV